MRKARGQSLVEYAILLALIAALAVAGLVFLGGSLGGVLSTVGTGFEVAPATGQTPPASTTPAHKVGDPCSPPNGGTWHLVPPDKWVCNKS